MDGRPRHRTSFARRLRKTQTDAERKLWPGLRSRSLNRHKFRRQHPIGPYTVDFCCLQKGLVIEVDGAQHAGHKERDNRRTEFLNSQGYRVVRFVDTEVLNETEGVLQVIDRALEGKT